MLLSPDGARAFHVLPPLTGGVAPACRHAASPPLLLATGGRHEHPHHRYRPIPGRFRHPCCMRSRDGGVGSGGSDGNDLLPANVCIKRRASGVGVLRCSEEYSYSALAQQRYTAVSAWRYEGSAVDIPWRSLGDVLFEMGACSCWMFIGEADGDQPHQEEQDTKDGGKGPGSSAAAGAAEATATEVQEGRGAMLTFIVERHLWGGVGTALEAACTLAGGPDGCFESLDWEEGPVECFDQWEATRSSEGFDTIAMRRLQISPVQRCERVPSASFQQVKLLEGQGWGDGEHPSTWMCLDFLETAIRGGEEVVDYGTGSGVLAAAAVVLGAKHVTAVDIDVEILAHARQNFLLNGISEKVAALHSRELSIGDLSAQVVVANMIAGPMLRQMAALVLAVGEGGLLCLSGLRPSDAPLIRREFGKYMDWDGGLEASRESSPWGEYVRLVGRPKPGLSVHGDLRIELERELSEIAVA